MGMEGIGASVVRKEDKRFITGKGRYVDDIKLLGMTHAHFIRSPHAHAKVKSIDTSAIEKWPGVKAVHVIAEPGTELYWAGASVVALVMFIPVDSAES